MSAEFEYMSATPINALRVGSLFSGIGGFDLGLERAGMSTAWFVEQDEFCQQVLAKHWPGVPCYGDIKTVRGADVEPIDLLCGGFPCQDLSYAGKGAGISEGTRSGLWFEFARLIRELRPRYVIVENVSALLARGLGVVLGDLAACGYDAEWDCLPASAFGAPHRRDRIWIVAYTDDAGCKQQRRTGAVPPQESSIERDRESLAHPYGVAGPQGSPLKGRCTALFEPGEIERTFRRCGGGGNAWEVEPDVGRVADGIPDRTHRLAALGNALVPPIPEWIGHRIMEFETCDQ